MGFLVMTHNHTTQFTSWLVWCFTVFRLAPRDNPSTHTLTAFCCTLRTHQPVTLTKRVRTPGALPAQRRTQPPSFWAGRRAAHCTQQHMGLACSTHLDRRKRNPDRLPVMCSGPTALHAGPTSHLQPPYGEQRNPYTGAARDVPPASTSSMVRGELPAALPRS